MKSRPLPNSLSKKANRCLVNVGIAINKEAIVHALQTRKLYPHHWPPLYGKKTHAEVCHWAGIDPETLPRTWPDDDTTPYPDVGIRGRIIVGPSSGQSLRVDARPMTNLSVRLFSVEGRPMVRIELSGLEGVDDGFLVDGNAHVDKAAVCLFG